MPSIASSPIAPSTSPKRRLRSNSNISDEPVVCTPVKSVSPRKSPRKCVSDSPNRARLNVEGGVGLAKAMKSPKKKLLDSFLDKPIWNPTDSEQLSAVKEVLHVSKAQSVIVCREDEQKRIVEFSKQCLEQEDKILVTNPANGEVIASVPFMGERETKDAISSAYDAFTLWSKLTAADRSSRLRKWYNLLIEHKQELEQLITLEQGKPLREAIAADRKVIYAANFIEYFAEEAKRVYGDIIPSPYTDRRLFVLKQPVGVVAAIIPRNYPLAMITRKA